MKFKIQRYSSHKQLYSYLKSSGLRLFSFSMFLFLFSMISILIWISLPSESQEGNTVSGRLIDTLGNPISDVQLSLRPYKEQVSRTKTFTPGNTHQIRTDSRGRFAFTNIHHKSIDINIHNTSKIGFEINVLSYEFGEITLYPFRGWVGSTVIFALDTGVKMENIVITADIRKRPKIRTRVFYADGTPVANSEVYMHFETKSLFKNTKGIGRGPTTTDADGYFVEYRSTDYPPEYYITLAIEHQGLYGKATPFILIDDVDIVLKLNGNPGSEMKPIIGYSERESALQALLKPPPMWVANKANGHAYKITKAQTIKDAMKQAEVEGAYLLSINDRAEEVWLSYIYGTNRIWIGLSDAEEEGKWKWHSGEPLDYKNWRQYQPDKGNTEDKDYVMTGYFDWGWEVYGEEFEKTILEKPLIHFTSQSD